MSLINLHNEVVSNYLNHREVLKLIKEDIDKNKDKK